MIKLKKLSNVAKKRHWVAVFLCLCFVFAVTASTTVAQDTGPQQEGSTGLEGVIPADPPSTGATISVPSNGQVFTETPITVSGICPDGLLVKVFKNEVFGGATECTGGSYSLLVDLFSGTNELVARVYDDLDQAGPDSNTVTVQFNDPTPTVGTRISLTTNYTKRGADPNQPLDWPIIISGGQGPYAVSVNWGDGSDEDLISREFPGPFDISNTYSSPGIFNITIKATDQNGAGAFLQVVGIVNGTPLQEETEGESEVMVIYRLAWWPFLVTLVLTMVTFWLGGRHQLHRLRRRLQG